MMTGKWKISFRMVKLLSLAETISSISRVLSLLLAKTKTHFGL